MKSLIIYIFSTVLFSACSSTDKKQVNQCLFILPDITDTLFAIDALSENTICKGLSVTTDNPNAGATVHFIPITNMRYTKDNAVIIPCDIEQDNEWERKLAIDSFKRLIQLQCDSVKTHHKGINGSAIFENLEYVLQRASECKGYNSLDIKVLSDLRQFSPLCNTYDTNKLSEFMIAPTLCGDWFDNTYYIPVSLKGITIWFIHQSKTVSEDHAFHIISTFLKFYLEDKGAKVFIQTTL